MTSNQVKENIMLFILHDSRCTCKNSIEASARTWKQKNLNLTTTSN